MATAQKREPAADVAEAADPSVAIMAAKRVTDSAKLRKGGAVKLYVPINGDSRRLVVAQVVEVEDEDTGTCRLRYMSEAGPQERTGIVPRQAQDIIPKANTWEPFPPTPKGKPEGKGGGG